MRFYYHRNWIVFYLFFTELNLSKLNNRLSLNRKLLAKDLIFYTRDIPCKYAQIFASKQIKLSLRYAHENRRKTSRNQQCGLIISIILKNSYI